MSPGNMESFASQTSQYGMTMYQVASIPVTCLLISVFGAFDTSFPKVSLSVCLIKSLTTTVGIPVEVGQAGHQEASPPGVLWPVPPVVTPQVQFSWLIFHLPLLKGQKELPLSVLPIVFSCQKSPTCLPCEKFGLFQPQILKSKCWHSVGRWFCWGRMTFPYCPASSCFSCPAQLGKSRNPCLMFDHVWKQLLEGKNVSPSIEKVLFL